jgi:hypothetical protein
LTSRWNYCTLFQARVEVDGSIITSQGPATTFEFALELLYPVSGPRRSRWKHYHQPGSGHHL